MVDCTRVVYDSDDENVITKLDPREEKSVMLTFDDGPGRALPKILEILREKEVRAVFFWQSRLLHHKRPWKMVLKNGHLIGTHSARHKNLAALSYEEQLKDISSAKALTEKAIGTEVLLFRPPFGQYNDDTIRVANELGMKTIMWRLASMDWELKDNPSKIIEYVVENLENGAIILLHELPQTVEALPELIRQIRQKGYRFELF